MGCCSAKQFSKTLQLIDVVLDTVKLLANKIDTGEDDEIKDQIIILNNIKDKAKTKNLKKWHS